MPRYAAVPIRPPFQDWEESQARAHSLRRLALQGKEDELDVASRQREREENTQIERILKGVGQQDFETAYEAIWQVNPTKAMELQARHRQMASQERETSIREATQARTAAKENIELQSGQPEASYQLSDLEAMPSRPITGVPSAAQHPVRLKPTTIPGIPALGIPGVSARPRTLEELARAKEWSDEYTLGPEQQRYRGSRLIATGAPSQAPEPSTDYARALARKERELKRALTSNEEIAFRTRYEAADFRPPAGSDDPTRARDRQEYDDYVRQWENQYKGLKDPTDESSFRTLPYRPPLDFATWRAQRRAPSASTVVQKPGWRTRARGRVPAAPTTPAQRAFMEQSRRPGVGTGPAATPPAILANEPPGEYDLADGSTWQKWPDGRVVKVK
mgnify:CR=1 FL=1